MHNYKIIYSETYRNDIIDVLDYLGQDYPEVAIKFLNKTDTVISSLSELPFKGTLPRDSQLRLKGYRMLIVDKYLVFYIPSVVDKTVKIHRILSTRQHYKDFL